ncbi:MAG: thioredoxin [Desulfarculales bacterium]|jgi:thioredoxin 1|nr:thioredoxin [Desulfarculales bacterium]
MAGKAVHISGDNFKTEVLESQTPALVDFWAPWCGPCKSISPVLDELALEYEDRVKLVKVNVDDNPGVAAQYGVRAIPTLIFFKGGQQVDQITGAVSKAALENALQKIL